MRGQRHKHRMQAMPFVGDNCNMTNTPKLGWQRGAMPEPHWLPPYQSGATAMFYLHRQIRSMSGQRMCKQHRSAPWRPSPAHASRMVGSNRHQVMASDLPHAGDGSPCPAHATKSQCKRAPCAVRRIHGATLKSSSISTWSQGGQSPKGLVGVP